MMTVTGTRCIRGSWRDLLQITKVLFSPVCPRSEFYSGNLSEVVGNLYAQLYKDWKIKDLERYYR